MEREKLFHCFDRKQGKEKFFFFYYCREINYSFLGTEKTKPKNLFGKEKKERKEKKNKKNFYSKKINI
jgi:hypothetical protein